MYEYDFKIAVLGGGTGLSTILRGLKRYPVEITAIVTVADDGGSSGSLRADLQIPPPGDIRNVLVSLSEAEPLVRDLFQYRFEEGNGLKGHPIGNLLIAAMTNITGDFTTAIRNLSEVLNVRGRVLPVCNEALSLGARYEDGTWVCGESNIPNQTKKIKQVYYDCDTPPKALDEAVEAIMDADMVILAPGSLYTSIIPNLLLEDIARAVSITKAKCVYCCNIMTQPGETTGFPVSEHLKAIEEHVGSRFIDKVLVNDGKVKQETIDRYSDKNSEVVEIDVDVLKAMDIDVIRSRIVSYTKSGEVRHNSKKVAAMLFSLLLDT